MIDEGARGVFAISATPFADDGALDWASLDRLTDFYLGHGVDGVTILGVMGEAPKLTADEKREVVRAVLARVAGRVPVIVGVSDPGMDSLVALAREAMDLGAAGVMVAPFAGLKTETAVLSALADVARQLPEVPLVFQDFPLTTGVSVSAEALVRLFEEVPSVVMLKHEDWPGLAKLSRVRELSESRGVRRVSVLVGNGGLFLPLELARGADGAMTGFAYPEMLVEVVRRHGAGDPDGAEDVYDAYLPLVRLEQQPGVGLAVRKAILKRRGAIASAAVRAPGPALDRAGHAEVERLMARAERRAAEVG